MKRLTVGELKRILADAPDSAVRSRCSWCVPFGEVGLVQYSSSPSGLPGV